MNMKWLLKILGAVARPLGISSPEDTRRPTLLKAEKKPSFQEEAGRTSEAAPPKNPASMQ
jgi:hypothetical protein